jgi:hypothetical protein
MPFLIALLMLLASPASAMQMIGFGAAAGVCGTGTTILGTDEIGASTFNGGIVNIVYFSDSAAYATAPICTGEIYFTEAVTENIKMLVYDSTYTLIATSTAITSTTANVWNVFTFDGTVQITSGLTYYIGWIHENDNYEPGVRNNGEAWVLQKDTTGSYASPPADISGSSSVSDTTGWPTLRIKN